MGMGHCCWLESWICQWSATKLICLYLLCSARYSLSTPSCPIHFIEITFLSLSANATQNHVFCYVSISFWRKAVIFDIFTAFHQVQTSYCCRAIHEILVLLPVILWSCVTTREPRLYGCVCVWNNFQINIWFIQWKHLLCKLQHHW